MVKRLVLQPSHIATLARMRSGAVVSVVLAIAGSIFLWQSFAAVSSIKGDLNGDNKVTISDLSILLTNFGKATTTGDLNADNKVTIADLSILLTNFGKQGTTTPPPALPPPTPVPTPSPTPIPGTSPYLAPGISKGMVMDNNGSIAQDAADMQTLGVTWNRGWLDCGEGSAIVGMVNALKAKGVSFIPTYNCPMGTSIATYKSKLAADMKILVPLGVHVWEIGNEMDGGWEPENNYCDNNRTAGNMVCAQKAYLEVQKAAYETVHANDPQGVMMYGGLSSYDVNLGPWLKEMNTSQAWQWMDAMGFHPYGNNLNESMASMETLKSYMSKSAAWANKPIWITEIGCWSTGFEGTDQNSQCSTKSEKGKADYFISLLNALKVWNKGTSLEIRTPVCWYILREDVNGYGMESNSRQPFDIFTAYKNYKF